MTSGVPSCALVIHSYASFFGICSPLQNQSGTLFCAAARPSASSPNRNPSSPKEFFLALRQHHRQIRCVVLHLHLRLSAKFCMAFRIPHSEKAGGRCDGATASLVSIVCARPARARKSRKPATVKHQQSCIALLRFWGPDPKGDPHSLRAKDYGSDLLCGDGYSHSCCRGCRPPPRSDNRPPPRNQDATHPTRHQVFPRLWRRYDTGHGQGRKDG